MPTRVAIKQKSLHFAIAEARECDGNIRINALHIVTNIKSLARSESSHRAMGCWSGVCAPPHPAAIQRAASFLEQGALQEVSSLGVHDCAMKEPDYFVLCAVWQKNPQHDSADHAEGVHAGRRRSGPKLRHNWCNRHRRMKFPCPLFRARSVFLIRQERKRPRSRWEGRSWTRPDAPCALGRRVPRWVRAKYQRNVCPFCGILPNW